MTGEKTKRKVPQMPATGYAARRMKYRARRPAANAKDLRTRMKVPMANVISSSQSMVVSQRLIAMSCARTRTCWEKMP